MTLHSNRTLGAALALLGSVLMPLAALAAPAVDAAHDAVHGAERQLSPLPPVNEGLIAGITTLVVFLGLLFVLTKFAWGPIASGLKAREDKIRKDLHDAEAARASAETTLKQYQAQLANTENTVREMLAKAHADAESLATSIRMRAQQEAEEIKEKANKDIEAARDAALSEIYEQTANLSTLVAEKILRRNINENDQRELVNQSLEQLGTLTAR